PGAYQEADQHQCGGTSKFAREACAGRLSPSLPRISLRSRRRRKCSLLRQGHDSVREGVPKPGAGSRVATRKRGASMQVVEIVRPGGPEVLAVVQRERPALGQGEVLIRVAAASVNRPDIQQRRGLYPPPPGASDIPGLDIAGIVEAAAPDVA